MSSNIAEALRRGPQATAHLAKMQAEIYPHVQTPGGLTLRRSQTPVLHRRRTYQVYNSSTTPETGLSSACFSDIRLQGCDVVDEITLRLTVQNGTGAALGQWWAHWVWSIISHVEILAENGSTCLERIEVDHLLREWAKLSRAQHMQVHKGLTGEFDANDPAPSPPFIGIGGSRNFFIPLLGSMLGSQELAPFALSGGGLIIRTYFRGPSVFAGPYAAAQIPNGTGGLTVTAFDAVVTAWQYDESEKRSLASRYALAGVQTPPLDIRYARPGFQRTIETVTNTTSFINVRLSSIQGLVTSMNLILRAVTTGVAVLYYPTELDLLGERGDSLYGQPLSYPLLLATECRDQDINNDSGTNGLSKVLPVPVGGEASEHSGAISGYLPMSGHHTLAIRFSSPPGSYEVTVIYRTVAHARIEKGHITVHSS